MSTVASLPPRSADAQPAAHGAPPRYVPAGTFWSHGICLGASVILATAPEVETLSRSIAALPAAPRPPRPVVSQYLFMVKTLSAAWSGHSRPALQAACAALMHYGDSYVERDAPLLGAALLHTTGGRIDAFAVALRLVDGLIRRLAAPLAGLASLHRDFSSYLAQMADASSDLEHDTVLVTQRLQADHVHAFVLAQQAQALRDRLDTPQGWRGLPVPDGPDGQAALAAQANLARLDRATDSAALEGVRAQLDRLREHQGATLDEAAYLQQLLPAVGAYLAALDRLGLGIQAALAGTEGLQEHLEGVKKALQEGSADGQVLHAQLQASLPGWRDLARRLAAPGTPGGGAA